MHLSSSLRITIAVLALAAGTAIAVELPESVSDCLMCHEDPDLVLELGDGSELPLFVDGETWAESVHAEQLICTDCHEAYDDDHPMGRSFANNRDYSLQSYETCKACHFDTYTRTLESVHYELLRDGLEMAPVCTDCHGAHEIANPHRKQAMISRSCASCHTEIYETYASSVHGSALVRNDNQDVPACTDCHTAHTIRDPTTARFHVASPEICVGCHGDAELMAPYGIPTDVATTYLSDFHGVTASLSRLEEGDPRQVVVTCVDCHGAHDMPSPAIVGDEKMKEKVAATCASCHEDASVDFPAAWLSHYRPSLSHAPLVYLVDLFYRIFIPFIIVGLALQVLLHLFRLATGR
ncbi:MAG: cytochrome c3 family protein [Acidobacteriota bacterium]|nr:cytochrome c3 family protein [Acidobacteriota bacterium]MDH3785202.1 cytochrome c3 family protein [Acidobacteriota bacterium]